MTQPKVTEDEQALLYIAKECGGAEAHRDEWPIIESLVAKGLAEWVSGPRGPNKEFRRFISKENV